jgi:hypothetical protein
MKPIIGALWVIGAIAALFAGENSAWGVTVSKPVKPYVFNKDLRTLPPVSGRPATHQEHPQRIKPGFQPIRPRPPGAPDPLWRQGKGAGNRLAGLSGPPPFPFTPPSPNFDTTQSGDGPPDANGAVGPNHYVQIVNSGPLFPTSTFEIFDKNGNLLSGRPISKPCGLVPPRTTIAAFEAGGILMSFMTISRTAGSSASLRTTSQPWAIH